MPAADLEGAAQWPARWDAGLVTAWQAKHGSPQQGCSLAAAGWTPTECKRAAEKIRSLDAAPAEAFTADAKLHKRFGVPLVELLAAQWPTLAPGTVLTVRRHAARGDRTQAAVVAGADGVQLVVATRTGGSWTSTTTRLLRELPDALSEVPALLRFRPGSMSWIRVPDKQLVQAVHERIRLSWADGCAEDGEDERWTEQHDVETWTEEDELIAEIVGEQAVARWIRLNELRVVAVQHGEDELAAALYDSVNEEFVPQRTLARSSWFSESGGAPVSWDGGAELVMLASKITLDRSWGDIEQGADVGAVDRSDTDALANLIVEWTMAHEFAVAAALTLEPVDPAGALSPDDRAMWQELIADVPVSYDMEEAALEDQVRARLAGRSKEYAQVAEALRTPDAPQGARLLATLQDVNGDGVLAPLVSGMWLE